MSSRSVLAERTQVFAFDVAARAVTRFRVVLSVPGVTPIFAVCEVGEEVRGRVISLTLPGGPADGGEVCTLSVVPERAGSRVSVKVRAVVARRGGHTVVADYWKRTLPVWLASLCDVAEGRALLPDGRMPAESQVACTPPARGAQPASVSAWAAIAAPVDDVWAAVYAPESAAILMSREGQGTRLELTFRWPADGRR